jgi:serine/threonine-protein kinase
MELSPGSVIAGRYRVDQRVGAGGMGEVWAGEHLSIGVKVAVKTLLPAAKVSHEVVARFKREAFLLGRIRSEYVARVLDFIHDESFGLVIVMEFIEGDSLARVLSQRRLTVEESVDLGADVASALCDLHRAHVVHRDLKPGNIILQPLPNGRKRAVVVDFGVSRMVSAGQDEDTITGITRANMAVGTVEYMAPEQILNSRDVTGGSDCYALGAIIYRALTAQHVYGDVYESELAHTKLTQDAPALETGRQDRVARGLSAVVARALRRRPTERYSNAEAMLAELTSLRDLARVAAVEMADSTTTTLDASPGIAHDAPTSSARAVSIPDTQPASAAIGAPPSSGSELSMPPSHPLPAEAFAAHGNMSGGAHVLLPRSSTSSKRRGVPRPLMSAAVIVALAIGGALGVFFARRGLPASEATAAQPAAAPEPPPEPREPPASSASASVAEIDLGEIEPPAVAGSQHPGPSPVPTSPLGAPARTPVSVGAVPPAGGPGGTAPPAPRASSTNRPAATSTAGGAPVPPRVLPPPVEKIEF